MMFCHRNRKIANIKTLSEESGATVEGCWNAGMLGFINRILLLDSEEASSEVHSDQSLPGKLRAISKSLDNVTSRSHISQLDITTMTQQQ